MLSARRFSLCYNKGKLGGSTMTISIDLSPETERKLRDLATERGQEPAEYARSLIEREVHEHSSSLAEALEPMEDPTALARAIAAMINRTPEQIAAARAHAIATFKPHTPSPPGTNGMERVYGQWPGDE